MNETDYIDRLRDLIKKNKYSLKDISREIGMTEAGFHRSLTKKTLKVSTLIQISEILDISVSDFFIQSSTETSYSLLKLKSENKALEEKVLNEECLMQTLCLTSDTLARDVFVNLKCMVDLVSDVITQSNLYKNIKNDQTNEVIKLYHREIYENEHPKIIAGHNYNDLKALKINTFILDYLYSSETIKEIMKYTAERIEYPGENQFFYEIGWEMYGKHIAKEKTEEVLALHRKLINKYNKYSGGLK